ncbi:branched-chain amino acid transport system permease protein [Enhydrobacter aerosaccus]|uniref:Branched-chain amino acid transport system permease protein n=1 Tax=Enhydrobacter aerosaccus TaxID=225324 RepID=A0A1T4JSC8_9HYPH|nr:branched-chain amino acid ABC transporter permease [Enhydrobacter aerosaccus]SJZ32957.1 branched-chain amino acid transport system permease protein [Enhydrobacter aerosaccus]
MGFAAAALLSFCFPDFIVFRFTQATVWSIALLGLVILCGISGQFSFAQAALYGMGGYTTALLAAHTILPLYTALGLAPLMGFAVGYGLGRVTGAHSLWTQALIGYALTIAFPQLLRWRVIERWTGGVQGLSLDSLSSPIAALSNDRWLFLLTLGLLAAATWISANIIAGRTGRALLAARDHDLSAAAQGIDVLHVRAMASGIAGTFFGMAGCLSAFQFGFVGPTTYGITLSIQMLFGAVIGGLYSPAGAILGGVLLEFLPGLVSSWGMGLSALLYAGLMVAAIVAMPTGIAGTVALGLGARHRSLAARRRHQIA